MRQPPKSIQFSAPSIIFTGTAHISLPGECATVPPVDYLSPAADSKVSSGILRIVLELGRLVPPTVVCIGTDRSTGDSLGPMVGTFLTWAGFEGPVIGTLENPVHAGNLHSLDLDSYGLVIAVDACLGTKQEVGLIMVKPGPLKPGLAVNKKLRPVGHLHIAGVVNVGGFMEYAVLQSTRLNTVMKMAQVIAAGLMKADRFIRTFAQASPCQGKLCPSHVPEPSTAAELIRAVPDSPLPASQPPQEYVRLR